MSDHYHNVELEPATGSGSAAGGGPGSVGSLNATSNSNSNSNRDSNGPFVFAHQSSDSILRDIKLSSIDDNDNDRNSELHPHRGAEVNEDGVQNGSELYGPKGHFGFRRWVRKSLDIKVRPPKLNESAGESIPIESHSGTTTATKITANYNVLGNSQQGTNRWRRSMNSSDNSNNSNRNSIFNNTNSNTNEAAQVSSTLKDSAVTEPRTLRNTFTDIDKDSGHNRKLLDAGDPLNHPNDYDNEDTTTNNNMYEDDYVNNNGKYGPKGLFGFRRWVRRSLDMPFKAGETETATETGVEGDGDGRLASADELLSDNNQNNTRAARNSLLAVFSRNSSTDNTNFIQCKSCFQHFHLTRGVFCNAETDPHFLCTNIMRDGIRMHQGCFEVILSNQMRRADEYDGDAICYFCNLRKPPRVTIYDVPLLALKTKDFSLYAEVLKDIARESLHKVHRETMEKERMKYRVEMKTIFRQKTTVLKGLRISVGDPAKNAAITGPFISYKVTTEDPSSSMPLVFLSRKSVVFRRYRHFEWLKQSIATLYPYVIMPVLPEKKTVTLEDKFSDAFIENRRDGLESFLNRFACDPYLGATQIFYSFLTLPEQDFEGFMSNTNAKKMVDQSQQAHPSQSQQLASVIGKIKHFNFTSAKSIYKVTSMDAEVDAVRGLVDSIDQRIVKILNSFKGWNTANIGLSSAVGGLSTGFDDFLWSTANENSLGVKDVFIKRFTRALEVDSEFYANHVDYNKLGVMDPLYEYIQILDAVRQSLKSLDLMKNLYIDALKDIGIIDQDLNSTFFELTALERSAAEENLKEAELKANSLRASLDDCEAKFLVSFNDFKRDMSIQNIMLKFSELQMQYSKRQKNMWQDALHSLEAVEPLPPIPRNLAQLASSNSKSSPIESCLHASSKPFSSTIPNDLSSSSSPEHKTYTCSICYENFPLDQGTLCCKDDNAHFLCGNASQATSPRGGGNFRASIFSCFEQMVMSQMTDRSAFISKRQKLLCMFCTYEKPPKETVLSEQDLADNAPHLLREYLETLQDVSRSISQQIFEKELQDEREMNKAEVQRYTLCIQKDTKAIIREFVHQHRMIILETVLTLRCPHCNLAIIDFDGCFAVQHKPEDTVSTLACNKYFCGWCLDKFETSPSCHEHVKVCENNPYKPSWSCPGSNNEDKMREFKRVQGCRQATLVSAYVNQHCKTKEMRSALIEGISKDLSDLNIILPTTK